MNENVGAPVVIILSLVAVATILVGVAIDSNVLGWIGMGLCLLVILLVILGLTRWGWETGDSPGGMGGP